MTRPLSKKCALTRNGGRRRCTEPPAIRMTVGCVHEHVLTGSVCAEHRQTIEEGNVTCAECARCGDPHKCVLLGRVVS